MAQRELLITTPSQTGDIPHVAAVLALYDHIDVLVVTDLFLYTSDPFLKFYRQAAHSTEDRIMHYRPEPAVPRQDPETEKRLYRMASTKLYNKLKNSKTLKWTQSEKDVREFEDKNDISLQGLSVSSFFPFVV
jgi:hypothetical protein